jgi:starch-binding outer membrane protein, SusD/RagB family
MKIGKFFDKYRFLLLLIAVILELSACSNFLDATPDSNLNAIDELRDLQELLDLVTQNTEFPNSTVIGSDEFYLTSTDYNALTNVSERNLYLWADVPAGDDDWYNCYHRIFNQNIVIESLSKIKETEGNKIERDAIEGAALFLRAYNFYHLAQLFAPQYSTSTLNEAGIPLRLSSDINIITQKSTVSQTYERIISDCIVAKNLLPKTKVFNTRPNRAAVWGLLARTYLIIGNYTLAAQAADSSLRYYDLLLDYNDIDTLAASPFPLQDNSEILFHSVVKGSGILLPAVCKVDTLLYNLYADNDLRKKLLFVENADGSYRFKGNYNGTRTDILFSGIAVDEVWLVNAECKARFNDIEGAMKVLNALMVKRYKKGTFSGYKASTKEDALNIVLKERRKELLLRGTRWSDLRRLNLYDEFKDTVSRNVNGVEYKLIPNSSQYILKITKQP